MSIRVKLTLFFALLLAASLIIMSVAIISLQQQQMTAQLENDIRRTADSLMGPLTGDRPEPPGQSAPAGEPPAGKRDSQAEASDVVDPASDTDEQTPPEPPDGHLSDHSPEEFDTLYQGKKGSTLDVVNLLDLDGNLIYSPIQRNSQLIPLEAYELDQLKAGESVWKSATIDQNEFSVYVKPVVKEGEAIGYIQVAKTLNTANIFLDTLKNTMMVIGLLEILVSAAIGWFVSGIMLNKISEITKTANGIREEQDFAKRVAYVGPQDEIGQLATAFNEMLENIQTTYERLKQSLVQQRNFVADVSHELRTPLTTISGNLALLGSNKKITEEDKQDMIHDMEEESSRLTKLVNELLTLARADLDERLCLSQIRLRPIVDECVRQLDVLDPSRKVSVSMSDDIEAYSERTKLKQLLIILMDNAYKHSDGDIRVEADQKGDSTCIAVIDYGRGIPTDQLESIFERFHKEGNSSSGFGLGLPIAKALAKSLNGTIEAASQPGAWTCFTIKLHSTAENKLISD